MRYYVECKAHRHQRERHYTVPPDLVPDVFTFPGYCECTYRREDIRAEAAPGAGWYLMFEPFVMLAWRLTGRLQRERAFAERFNARGGESNVEAHPSA